MKDHWLNLVIPMCVCVSRSVVSDSATPWTVASQALLHGILEARMLEWVALISPGDLPDQGIEPESPALQADSLSLSH